MVLLELMGIFIARPVIRLLYWKLIRPLATLVHTGLRERPKTNGKEECYPSHVMVASTAFLHRGHKYCAFRLIPIPSRQTVTDKWCSSWVTCLCTRTNGKSSLVLLHVAERFCLGGECLTQSLCTSLVILLLQARWLRGKRRCSLLHSWKWIPCDESCSATQTTHNCEWKASRSWREDWNDVKNNRKTYIIFWNTGLTN